MARSAATVQAELDALKAARATGALRVRFREREVEYRSLKDMTDAIALLEDELASLTGQTSIKQVRFLMDKGLY